MKPKDVMDLKFGTILLKDGTELRDVEVGQKPEDLDREMTALSELIKRHGGQVQSADLSDPALSTPQCQQRTSSRPKSLKDAWAGYMTTLREASGSTKEGYTESFTLFAELLGGEQRLLHELTDAEILDYAEALAHVPAHAKKRNLLIGTVADLKFNLPKYLNTAGELVDAEVISGNTADQHVVRIRSFLNWTTKLQHRTGGNPLDGISLASKNGRDRALPFIDVELSKILDADSLMESTRPTQYWTILLSLYTGARANELACLEITDIVTQGSVRCFSIIHDPDAPQGDKGSVRSSKRTKNPSSVRLVPIHPDIFELGFEDYLEDLKLLGATRLFPNAPLDAKGKRERRLSHDGNEYLKKVGVHRERVKVLHSFRSVVINKLRDGGFSQDRRFQWTGHKDDSIQGTHYLVPEQLNSFSQDGFRALTFPQVDKLKLRYRKGWWNEYIKENMKP